MVLPNSLKKTKNLGHVTSNDLRVNANVAIGMEYENNHAGTSLFGSLLILKICSARCWISIRLKMTRTTGEIK
jgi:hypothetical protein